MYFEKAPRVTDLMGVDLLIGPIGFHVFFSGRSAGSSRPVELFEPFDICRKASRLLQIVSSLHSYQGSKHPSLAKYTFYLKK